MNLRSLAALAAVVVFAGLSPARAEDIRLLSFTGVVEYQVGNGPLISVVPGTDAPVIPAGAKIRVLDGTAVLQTGTGEVITAPAGSSLLVRTVEVAGGKQATRINVGPGSEGVDVKTGFTTVTVEAGEGLQAESLGSGLYKLTSTQGTLALKSDSGESTSLSQGQQLQSALAPRSRPDATDLSRVYLTSFNTVQLERVVQEENFLPGLVSPSSP